MKDLIHTTIDSPLGTLSLTAADGYLTRMSMAGQKHAPVATLPVPGESGESGECEWTRPDHWFDDVTRQLRAYFGGTLTRFEVPVRLDGTEFQRRVWRCLQDIPYGETISYGELARAVGSPNASRAVGLANGRNPVAVIVPCHRVIGADGRLTGYAGGLDRKTWLLQHEATTASSGIGQTKPVAVGAESE